MLYLFVDPASPEESRAFLYHLPTHTLAEHFITSTGNHHLRVHQDSPVDDQALTDFVDWLKTRNGHEHLDLTTRSGQVDYSSIPDYIILISAQGGKSVLIHYPATGFTAGLCEDGTKISPHWRDPASLSREQRSHILDQAAETLMQAIARHQ